MDGNRPSPGRKSLHSRGLSEIFHDVAALGGDLVEMAFHDGMPGDGAAAMRA